MSEEFPSRLVFGSLVLTPLVILTFPVSVPAILAYRALRHHGDHFNNSNSTGSVYPHSYYGGFNSTQPTPYSHGFRKSLRSRF